MNIAIDLLWLRPSKVGGTESYTRNLLDGLSSLEDEFEFTLVVSKNVEESFRKYTEDSRFHILVVNIDNSNIGRRILWQFMHQNHFLRKNDIRHCFVPVYCRPIFNGGVKYINVIHDIQAYHYPQYHPFYEVWYSKLMWLCDRLFDSATLCTTQFVKDDIVRVYKFNPDKVSVINIPILIDKGAVVSFDEIKDAYKLDRYGYYYTVCQLIPHKNLKTLIEAFKYIRDNSIDLPNKLIISGVNGNAADELRTKLEELKLQDDIILTGFVSNEMRNTLYKYCKAFLFPSVFEGFGMPPLEAMFFGRPVLTTKCASIPEVTMNKANYVDNPYDTVEWVSKLQNLDENTCEMDFSKYDATYLAKENLNLLNSILG